MLLKEAYTDWNKKLIFTNYAPESEKLYLKTGWFFQVHKFRGARAYLFPKTKKIFGRQDENTVRAKLFSLIDACISVLSKTRVFFYHGKMSFDIKFEESERPDEDCYKAFENNKPKHFFNRGRKEYHWIFSHPWLTAYKPDFDERYPFSSYSGKFFYKFVKVLVKNELKGIFIFSVRDGNLKTLGFWLDEKLEIDVAGYLKRFCIQNKIETLTVYNGEVANELLKTKYPFLHVKKYGQIIYSTFDFANECEKLFQDGDGDACFT